MIGAELVEGRQTRAPAVKLLNALLDRAFRDSLLPLGCGESTVRFMHGISFRREFVDEALAIFEGALSILEEEMGLI